MIHADRRSTPGRGGPDVLLNLILFGLIESRVSGRNGFDLQSNRISNHGHDLRRPCDWVIDFVDGFGKVQFGGGRGGGGGGGFRIDEIVMNGVNKKAGWEIILYQRNCFLA